MDGRPWSMVRDRARAVYRLWSSIYHRAPLRMFRGLFFGFYPCHPVNPRSVFSRGFCMVYVLLKERE
jgi:hypothetical protein